MIPHELHSYYRLHSRIYDITRWSFLFGRNSLNRYLPELPEDPRILDLGCGTGKHLEMLIQHYPGASITGLDQSEHMLGTVDPSLTDSVTIRNDLYTPESFSADEFDLIVCSYSLTMMEHPATLLPVLKTHLRSGGFLLALDFDSTPFLWFNRWMKVNHVYFDHNWFRELDAEFERIKLHSKSAYCGLYTYSVFLGFNL